MEKIRFEQARLLKKEEKWADAIEMYLLGYLAKSSWNRKFQEDMFVKDIKSSANKLNWDDSVKAGEPVLVPDLPGSEGKLLRRIWRSKSPGRPDGAAAVSQEERMIGHRSGSMSHILLYNILANGRIL